MAATLIVFVGVAVLGTSTVIQKYPVIFVRFVINPVKECAPIPSEVEISVPIWLAPLRLSVVLYHN